MAEETKFKIWQVIQSVIAALLVFAITHLSNTLSGLTENVIRHDVILSDLVEFRKAGDRYTSSDGKAERDARISADTIMTEKIEAMNNNQIRMWKEIRNLISEMQGAKYRLDSLDKHLDKAHGN